MSRSPRFCRHKTATYLEALELVGHSLILGDLGLLGFSLKNNAYTVLHKLLDIPGTGIYPQGALVQDNSDSIYGVTSSTLGTGEGTIFELSSSGVFTELHNFNGQDGSFPTGLVLDADGILYGSTQLGRTSGFGTVFQFAPGGTVTTLFSFNGTDGESLIGSLLQTRNRVFPGTTPLGGVYDEAQSTAWRSRPHDCKTDLEFRLLLFGPGGLI